MEIDFNYSNSSSKEELVKLYKTLRAEAPTFWSSKHNAWIISRYDDVIAGLGNHELFTYENTDSIVIRDLTCMTNDPITISEDDRKFFQIQLPPEYPMHRKKLLDIYNKAIKYDIESKINENINKLFLNISNAGIVDIKSEITNKIPLLTICDLMGYEHEDSSKIFEITSSLMERSSIEDRIEICKKSYKFLKLNPPPLLINADDKKVAISFCMGMMLGGTNSLTGAFPNLLYNIYNYKNQFNLIVKNNNLLNNFIQETLRHTFIQSNLIRTASRDYKLYDTNIKKGDTVAFLLGSANFDETKFGSDADCFNIDRNYKKTNLAFGHGMYRCIGFQTAIIQLSCFIKFIIKNYNSINIQSFTMGQERDFTGSLINNIYGSYTT